MFEFFQNTWATLSSNPITASVTTTAIIAIPSLIFRLIVIRRLSGKEFMIGHYYGYHPLDEGGIVAWEAEICKAKRGRLKLRMQEQNQAAYEYEGFLETREGYFYSQLTGKTHDTNAFIVLSIPFNRSNAMPATSGILCGVTPDRDVTAVKYLICRTPMRESDVKRYFKKGTSSRIKADDPPFKNLLKAQDDKKE